MICFSKVHVKWMYKSATSQNYRILIELKKFDLCEVSKSTVDQNDKAGMAHMINFFNNTLGGVITPCPYKVLKLIFYSNRFLTSELLLLLLQSFSVQNVSFSKYALKSRGFVPNGKHIVAIRVYRAGDENILTFMIFSTFRADSNNFEY